MLKTLYTSPLLISVVIAVITLIIFSHVLSADFVMWDDDVIIYENPNIQDTSLYRLGKIFTDVDSMMRYNPLTLLSWNITYRFWKLNPFWYHLGNWLLHGLNAALVFLLLRKLLVLGLAVRNKFDADSRRVTISAATGALLWSLHPLRVEPVAWCTDRTYCQALFFLLLSLLFYLRASEAGTNIRRYYLFLAASVTLYIMSLLSYAIGMTFFLVLIILDIYPLKKLGGNKGWWTTSAARRTILEKLPFVGAAGAVALVTVCIRIASAGVWEKPVSIATFGLLERFMQALYIWAYYIWRPWYPVNLSPVYTTLVSFDPLSPAFIGSAVLVIGIITLLIFFRHRWPLGLALAACHFVLLVPVLGIMEHPHYPCDRYSLIVSISWSILLAAWLANYKIKASFRNITLVLSIIIIGVLGLLTFRQTRVWNSSTSLFEHILRTLGDDPYSYDAHFRFARFLAQHGQIDKAIEHLQQAVKIDPKFAEALNNLGLAYDKLGRNEEAVEAYKQAIKLKPDYSEAYYNLGGVYYKLGRRQEATEAYKQAIGLKPDYAEAYNNLGVVYDAIGQPQDAITVHKEAIKIKPNYAESYYNLGVAYGQLGRYQEAIESYNQAIKIKPDLAEAYNNLGSTYNAIGLTQEAIEAYKQAIKIKPDNAEAYNNLANSCSKLSLYKEAIEAYKQALRIKPDDVRMHFNLGVTYLSAGDRDSAIKQYEILKTLDSNLATRLSSLIK